MKKVVYICLFALMQLIAGYVHAQNSSYTAERRAALVKALDLIYDYERFAKLESQENIDGFKGLFKSSDISIYNDLLGISSKKELSVNEYIQLKKGETKVTTIIIKNVKKLGIEKLGDVWKIICGFDKEMSFSTKCGVFFSSKEFYGCDHQITMEMEYDPKSGQCLIEKLTGKVNSDAQMPEEYCVIVKDEKTPENLQVYYGGKVVTYNQYDQAVFSGAFNPQKLASKDPDVKVVAQTDKDCSQLVTLQAKARRMRMRLHYDIGLGDAFSPSLSDNDLSLKSSQNNLGIDFGYVFPSKSRFKTGVFLGIGLENSKMDLSYQKLNYSFDTDEDVDKDTYNRNYNNLLMKQQEKLTSLTIPVYFDFSVSFNNALALYLDLGVKARMNLSSSATITEGSAEINGLYSQYQNLLLDEQWGCNGFGHHVYTDSELDCREIQDVNRSSFDFLTGAGLRYNIPRLPLSLELGVNYQKSLNNLIEENSNMVKLQNVSNSNALIYNSISEKSNMEHVRNLTESLGAIKNSSLKFHLGVTYIF